MFSESFREKLTPHTIDNDLYTAKIENKMVVPYLLPFQGAVEFNDFTPKITSF